MDGDQQNSERSTDMCSQLGFIHDELQFECAPEHRRPIYIWYIALQRLEYYNMRIRIDGSNTRKHWSETH